MKKTQMMFAALLSLAALLTSCTKEEEAPVAGFTFSSSQVDIGEYVSFSDNSEGTVISYAWSFPGGTPASSSEKNPEVFYNVPGFYSVSLTVTNDGGSDKVTLDNIIEVLAGPPTAKFSASTTFANVGDLIELYDESTGNPTSWTWTISGPGIFEFVSDQNTSFIAQGHGFYDIKLWVSNDYGYDETEKENYIEAYAPGLVVNNTSPSIIVVDYEGNTEYINPGETVKLYDPNNDNSLNYRIKTLSSFGLELSSDWETADLSNGDEDVDFEISSEYFFLTMENKTINTFNRVVVNAGTVAETSESCSINFWDETTWLGYYKAYSNTEIQFHFENSNQYIYWNNINWSSLGHQNIILNLVYDGRSRTFNSQAINKPKSTAGKTIILK
jgi:PKD repeat protein